MNDSYGVYPDGLERPTAVFHDLEDAIAWALQRYGEDAFAIRFCPVSLAPVAAEEARAAS